MADDLKMLRVHKFVTDFFSQDHRAVWSSQCSTPMTWGEFSEWMESECDCGAHRVNGVCPNGCGCD